MGEIDAITSAGTWYTAVCGGSRNREGIGQNNRFQSPVPPDRFLQEFGSVSHKKAAF